MVGAIFNQMEMEIGGKVVIEKSLNRSECKKNKSHDNIYQIAIRYLFTRIILKNKNMFLNRYQSKVLRLKICFSFVLGFFFFFYLFIFFMEMKCVHIYLKNTNDRNFFCVKKSIIKS